MLCDLGGVSLVPDCASSSPVGGGQEAVRIGRRAHVPRNAWPCAWRAFGRKALPYGDAEAVATEVQKLVDALR